MEVLGSPADNKLRFTLLNKMIADLITRPDMLGKLTIHITNVIEQHPNDAEKLYQVLRDKAENLAESTQTGTRIRRPRIAAAGQALPPICPI